MTMDFTRRNDAEILWRHARLIKNDKEKHAQLNLVAEQYRLIQDKTIEDISNLARLCSDIALLNFNNNHDLEARS